MSQGAVTVASVSQRTGRQPTSALVGVGVGGATVFVAVLAWWVSRHRAPVSMLVLVAIAVAWGCAAMAVTLRRDRAAGVVVQGLAVAAAVGVLSRSLDSSHQLTGAGALAVDIGQRLALTLSAALVFHLLMTLPEGRIIRGSHRLAVTIGYAVAVAVGAALMADRTSVSVWPVALLWLVTTAALPVANRSYRSAAVADQRRMQWIGWAVLVATEFTLVAAALSLVLEWPHHVPVIALAVSGIVPLGLCAGTVARLLPRVDRLLTNTVSLTGLTALIIGAYLVALAAFGRRPVGDERSLLLLSMVAAAGAAIAYHPARVRLTERANRLVYGEVVSPDEALRTWGSRLTRAIPLDELLLQLAETLRKSMQLRCAQIWTGSNGRYEIAAMVPHRTQPPFLLGGKESIVVSRAGVSGGTWIDIWLPGLVDPGSSTFTRVAPIAHSGELLGLIVCERSPDRASFTDEDDRVLTELARQVGLALHNVQLDTALQASLDELRHTNEELRASLVRVVTAGDRERRKLERNLHDGAQQHLVSLAVKLRLAKDALEDDPADAATMIDEIRADLQEAITELRSLAHGIYPPLLMSGGLGEALPAAAGRAAVSTSTEVVVGRHSQEVEAAVYFCCLEALQNAGKYAGDDASAVVKVWEANEALHWQVADTGPGFDSVAAASTGHGFVNMRDRMGSLGGSLEVISSPGAGATIRGHLPLA